MNVAPHFFRIGDIQAAVLADKIEAITPAKFDGIFNRDDSADIRDAFARLYAEGRAPMFCRNILYLNAADQHILIDTGEGHHAAGLLLDSLQQAEIDPAQIGLIVITHFHLDHIGGLLDAAGKLVYPNARLAVPRAEWEYAMRADVLAAMPDARRQILQATFAPYLDTGRIQWLADGDAIAPGITAVSLPGHTPGHMGVQITSGGDTLLHLADTAHLPLQGHFIHRAPRFDYDPVQAATTRRAAFEQAAPQRTRVMLYHYPFSGIGHVAQSGEAFVWHAD